MDNRDVDGGGIWQRLCGAVGTYVHSPDPVQRSCNTIALLVASNQPFYPLYIRYLVGNDGGVSLLTLLSTPFFVAVPALARRAHTLGLAALPVVGLVNGMIATLAFGRQAGIELFAIPCMVIAAAGTWRGSRLVLLLSTIALLLYFAVFSAMSTPLHNFTPGEIESLYRLNMFSVAGLTLYIAYSLGTALRTGQTPGRPD
jgi:hypothetical protein